MSIEASIEAAVTSAISNLEKGSIEDLRTIVREELARAGSADDSGLRTIIREALREELLATAEKQKEGLLKLLRVA